MPHQAWLIPGTRSKPRSPQSVRHPRPLNPPWTPHRQKRPTRAHPGDAVAKKTSPPRTHRPRPLPYLQRQLPSARRCMRTSKRPWVQPVGKLPPRWHTLRPSLARASIPPPTTSGRLRIVGISPSLARAASAPRSVSAPAHPRQRTWCRLPRRYPRPLVFFAHGVAQRFPTSDGSSVIPVVRNWRSRNPEGGDPSPFLYRYTSVAPRLCVRLRLISSREGADDCAWRTLFGSCAYYIWWHVAPPCAACRQERRPDAQRGGCEKCIGAQRLPDCTTQMSRTQVRRDETDRYAWVRVPPPKAQPATAKRVLGWRP